MPPQNATVKSLFVRDDSPAAMEKALSKSVEEAVRELAEVDGDHIERLCRRHWERTTPRIKERLERIGITVPLVGDFHYISPSYCEMFGKTEKELLGKAFMPLVHEDDQDRAIAGLAATRQPPDFRGTTEHRSLTRHGWRWMSWTGAGVLDENGNVVASIATGRA